MKKFTVAMVIQGIDKVSGPTKGIVASIRKMVGQSEEAAAKSSHKSHKHAEAHAKHHGHGIGGIFSEGIGKVFEAIPEVAAVAGIVGGVEGLVEGFKKLTEASDEAAAAQTRLSNMMLHVRGTTKEDVASVNELAEKLEGKTAYKHTLFETAASQFAVFGMNGKQIRQMLPAFADYEAMQKGLGATNEDAVAGAKLLGKAYTGNVGALRRAGIVFTAAQEQILKTGTAAQRTAVLIKGIEGKSGGLAGKQLLDPKGQIQQAGNIWEAVKEKMGAALTPIRLGAMKLLSGALPYLDRFANALPRIFAQGSKAIQTEFMPVFNTFRAALGSVNIGGLVKGSSGLMSSLSTLARPLLSLWDGVKKLIGSILGSVTKWLVELWTNSQPGLKDLADAFKPILDALVHLWHGVIEPLWHSVLAPLLGWLLGKLVPFLVNVLGPVFKFLGKVVAWVLNTIVDMISGLFSWLGKVWPVVSKFFVSLWGKIKIAFGVLKQVLFGVWIDIWDSLFKWVEDRWGSFLDVFKKVGSYFGIGSSSPASSPRPTSLGGSGFAPMPIQQMNLIPIGGAGPVSGQIHVSHDPGLKVKVTHDPLGLFNSHLGRAGGY